jgi:hypothetical protein
MRRKSRPLPVAFSEERWRGARLQGEDEEETKKESLAAG